MFKLEVLSFNSVFLIICLFTPVAMAFEDNLLNLSLIVEKSMAFHQNLKTFDDGLCWNDIQRIFKGLSANEDWAFRISDSSAKVGNGRGLAEGNVIWFGYPTLCQNITTPYFKTHFCWLLITKSGFTFRYDLCLPETCEKEYFTNLTSILTDIIDDFKLRISIKFECIETFKEFNYDVLFTMAVITCCFVILMVVVCTLLHLRLKLKTNKEPWKLKLKVEPNNYSTVPMTEIPRNQQYVISKRYNEKSRIQSPEFMQKMKTNETKYNLTKSIIIWFSAIENMKKLYIANHPERQLGCIGGIRVFALFGVVFGHLLELFMLVSDNPLRALGYSETHGFTSYFILSAINTVDTFFTISGLVITYSTLNANRKGKRESWHQIVFNRFLRLSPAFYFIAAVILVTVPRRNNLLQSGFFEDLSSKCEEVWWTHFLYINNFIKPQCLRFTWYLANEMQLSLVAPFIILFLRRSRSAGIIALTTVFLSSITYTFTVSYMNGLNMDLIRKRLFVAGKQTFEDKVYINPFSRLGSYVIGMTCGWLLFEMKCEIKISKAKRIILWLFCITCFYWTAFYLYHFASDGLSAAIFITLKFNFWALAVCILIFLCCTGNGGIINGFLSWHGWSIFSRLSYSTYLAHIAVIIYSTGLGVQNLHLTLNNLILNFLSEIQIIFLAGLALHLTVEAPAQHIINFLMKS